MALQVPLSYRDWPGLHNPGELGLSNLEFVLRFGRHMPGGGVAEPAGQNPDPGRWKITGPLEIDCLHCHSADAGYDSATQEGQVILQNFRYSPTVTAHLADVRGDVRNLPDTWNWEFGDISNPQLTAPTVKYYRDLFDANDAVFLDITRRMAADRCYFCHSFRPVGPDAPHNWQRDRDVHLAAGLTCSDCHRNALDHAIARGYEGEPKPGATNLSCRTCHYGDPDSADPVAQMGRRMGAPRPQHAGMPAVHLEKISCTACHSGPWPSKSPQRIQTSMNHALGLSTKPRDEDMLPVVQAPVFVRGASGQIEPHRLVWPAYWGRLKDGEVSLIPPSAMPKGVAEALKAPKQENDKPLDGTHSPSAEQIAAALMILGGSTEAGQAVYVANGRVYAADNGGGLTVVASPPPGAQAYSWALAHDVRPAAQSLGATNCQDCHATDSAFLFSIVEADGPFDASPPRALGSWAAARYQMTDMEKLSGGYHYAFAASFGFRPMLKVIGFAAVAVVLAVLLLYGFKALSVFLSGQRPTAQAVVDSPARRLWNALVYMALAGSFGTLAVTGFAPLAEEGVVRGYWLIFHTVAGGVFAVSLAMAALSWPHRCRLGLLSGFDRAARPSPLPHRLAYWLMMTLGLVSLSSMMVSMTKLLGPDGLEVLRAVHLYSGMALLAVAALHLASLRGRPRSAHGLASGRPRP